MELSEVCFQKICRICAIESDEKILLFNTTLLNNEVVISDFINKITGLEIVENDGLPNTMCLSCVDKLSKLSDFVQLIISTDSLLKNQLIFNRRKDRNVKPHSEQINELGRETSTIIAAKQIGDKYKCKVCNITFNNKSNFKRHEKTHESNPFKCGECMQSFSKKLQLNVHLRSHVKNEDKKFICKSCGRQFAYEYLLKQHEYKHSDQKPFPCTECSKGCLTAESLRRHMKIHDENYVKKKHICTVCSKEFAYPSFLAEHMKNHTGERPHLCSICGKGFRQSGALHYHQRVHTGYKPFICKICNGNFMSQSVLKVHMRKHTNERPYVCHICGMAFRQSTDLRSHQRTHSGDKPVLCPICGKRMSTTGQLTIHIRSHTGEKPFVCGLCSKAFTTKTMLVKHERIHTGERPYVCDICGRAFNQSSTLKTHRNTHQMNRRRKKNERKPKAPDDCTASKTDNCDIVYKTNCENIETEIVTEQFISDGVDDINLVKSQMDSAKAEFTVILPAPIPLLQNL